MRIVELYQLKWIQVPIIPYRGIPLKLMNGSFMTSSGEMLPLFSRWDEVESAWMVADQLIQYREQAKIHFPNYAAGSMGPEASFELLAKDGRKWWNI